MKNISLLICGFIFLSMKTDNDRKILICQKWVQFAIKKYNSDEPITVDSTMAIKYIFKPDGTYGENMNNNTMQISGKWFLNSDQTKIAFTLENLNGKDIPPFPNSDKIFNIVILKLTSDTLIYGMEMSIGKKGQALKDYTHVHNDLYFVKQE